MMDDDYRLSDAETPLLDLNKLYRTPIFWKIQNWIPESGIVVLCGAPNSGKTFFALDMTMHIASGTNWFGYEVLYPRKCLYLALEGIQNIQLRLQAIKQNKPKLFESAIEHLMIPKKFVNFTCDQELERLIDFMESREVTFFVIDTLSAALNGEDESSSSGMGRLISKIKNIIYGQLGNPNDMTCMILHHPGKDSSRGARGHSSLAGAIDTEIILTKNKEILDAKLKKQRDETTDYKIQAKLTPIVLVRDFVNTGNWNVISVQEQQKIIASMPTDTSCVIQPTNCDLKTKKSTEPPGKAFIALNALHKSIEMSGELCDRPDLPKDIKVVSKETWSKQCKIDGLCSPDAQEHSFQRALKRALESLEAKELVATNVGYIWPL